MMSTQSAVTSSVVPSELLETSHSPAAHGTGNVHPQLSPSRARDDSKWLQEVKGFVHAHAEQGEGTGEVCAALAWGPLSSKT